MVSEHQLSERRACRLVGLSRDSYRHPPQADQATVELHEKIVEIAHVRRRFGYRRIHDLLRPHFPGVNHKRVYRLYRQANLAVRRRKKGKRPVNERVPLQLARTVNEVWSMDFVSDSLSGGRRLKYLTVADDCKRTVNPCCLPAGSHAWLCIRRCWTASDAARARRCGWPCAWAAA